MHTVNEMFDKYERDSLSDLSPRTRVDYRRHIKFLREHFGNKDVREVTRPEIEEFMNVPKGKIQKNRQLAVFSLVFNKALKWGWLEGNPCSLIERHQPRKPDRQLTPQEFEAAKKLAAKRRAGQKTALVMELALHTGQLQGDIISLRWSQVDSQSGTILFRDSHTKRKVTVLITPEIRQLLDRAKKLCGEGEYVITTRKDTRYTSEGFRAVWQRLMTRWVKTGNDRFTFHNIRQLSRKTFAAQKETRAADPVDDYPQFEPMLKAQAASNAPYYKVFFCLEQLIRKRVAETLHRAVGDDWWESEKIAQSMRQEVRALVTREVDSATTPRSMRMVDYTTFGQLGQIIRENWDLFDDQFTSKGAVGNVLARLNLARGPIAHCCTMSELEIERLGITVRDWFNILKNPD